MYFKTNGGHCNPMPNSLIDELLKITSSNSETRTAPEPAGLTPGNEALRALTTQIDALRGVYQAQTTQTLENTAAVVQNTRSRANEVVSTVASVARASGSALGGGLAVSPLISGIAKLFGIGQEHQKLPSLNPFALPTAVSLDGGLTQSGASPLAGISYGQSGLPRTIAPAPSAGTTISVNVQTIDSRSFLDHSDDIARAVREAMLNSHPLNDVIAEI